MDFGNKKSKWVKLPQFESLGGLSVTLETLEAKVKIDEYFKGGIYYMSVM
jgi:hypothetical protein